MTAADNHQLEPLHYDLQPGYVFANTEPSLVSVELGSGVAVCLWDRVLGIGGMSHFQIPRPGRKEPPTAKYGQTSVMVLIKMLLKMGSRKENLEAQIYGGGHRHGLSQNIGRSNVRAAKKVLKKSSIPVVSEDTGGTLGRRILYHTRTNEVLCMKTHKSRQCDWYPYFPNQG